MSVMFVVSREQPQIEELLVLLDRLVEPVLVSESLQDINSLDKVERNVLVQGRSTMASDHL
jgi:hypothetical protein